MDTINLKMDIRAFYKSASIEELTEAVKEWNKAVREANLKLSEVYDGFLCTDSFEDSHDYHFDPVPLTEEILQKNLPTPEEIVWWPLKDGSFRVEMQDDTHLIIGKYNYVHELQHALRLSGKEGEIKL